MYKTFGILLCIIGSMAMVYGKENIEKNNNEGEEPWSIKTPMQGHFFLGGSFGSTGFGLEGGFMLNEKLSLSYQYNKQVYGEVIEINNKPVNNSRNNLMMIQHRIAGSASFGGVGLRITRNTLETTTQSVVYRPVISLGVDTKGIERKIYIAAQLILSTDIKDNKRYIKSHILTSLGYKF